MKPYHKITLCLLAAAIMLNVSCKKNADVQDKTDNSAAIAKQVALDLYRSLSSGITTTANNGTKTNGTHTLVTMDAVGCGSVVTTQTNNTVVLGDTTRTNVGNRVFTYMCNGYFSNNKDLDAYTILDTLTTTDQGAAFKNSYNVTLNYVVKSLDANYSNVQVTGNTSTTSFTSKLNGSDTTETHSMHTDYTWNWVKADRTGAAPVFVDGYVDFVTQTADKDAATPAGKNDSYNGRITFKWGNKLWVDFHWQDIYHSYTINLVTGVVSEGYN